MKRLPLIIGTLLLMALLCTGIEARGDELAGIVIIASGEVKALKADHPPRILKRRTPFYVGETIRVAVDAKAQIRFADGTLLSLRPDTELRVDAFHYDADGDGAEDKNFFTLLKGGFRTITGAVGKRHPEAYKVSTPVATIGVRGTVYSAALDKELYVGVWQGGVTVQNDKGRLDLGMNAAFNFARIDNAATLPKGLMAAPPVLLEHNEVLSPSRTEPRTAPAAKPAEERAEEDGTAPAGPEPTSAEAADQALPPQPASATTSPAGSTGDAPPVKQQAGLEDTSLTPPDSLVPPPLNPPLPVIGGLLSSTTATAVGGAPPVQTAYTDLNNDGVPDLLLAADLRLSSAEAASLDRVGLMIAGGNPGPYPMRLGRASDGSGGKPLFAWNGLRPDQAGFATMPAIDVIRIGTATAKGVQSDGSYPVSWGTWNGVATAPAIVQTDPANPTLFTPLATQVFWVTAVPTTPAAIATLSGKGVYQHVIAYRGGSNLGSLTALYMNTGVNFGTGAVQGDMYIHTAGDYWGIKYGGTVSGSVLNLSVNGAGSHLVSAVNGIQPVGGALDAVFTGSGGAALAGAFDFHTLSGPSADVDGIFLVDKAPMGDLRLTATEKGALDRVGLAVVDDMSSVNSLAAAPFLAQASDGSGGAPLLASTAVNGGGFPIHILRQGLTRLSNLQANPAYTRSNDGVTVTLPVSWGGWNNDLADAVLDQNNPNDPQLNTAILRPVNWITVVPTAAATLSTLSGSINYTNLLGMVGTSSGGDITGPSATALVDFTTGNVSGNMNFTNTAADFWNTNFSGTLSGAALKITSVSGTFNGGPSVTGKVNGYLTGPRAEGMAGVFDYEAIGNPAVHAEGSFLLGCGTVCP